MAAAGGGGHTLLEDEGGVDLGRQVGARLRVAPTLRVLQVEVDHLACVALPVAARVGGVRGGPERAQGSRVGLLQEIEPRRAALLHGAHPVGVPDGDEQVVAHLCAQEVQVVLALHLVPHDLQRDAEVPCVLLVLAVDRDPLTRRLGDQERHVEAGEHAGGEGVRARGHVDDHVLVAAVDEMVQAQLHRSDLGVVAGDTEVGLGEGARDHQTHGPAVEFHGSRTGVVHRVVLAYPQQARALAGRGRLDHRVRGGDPWIRAAQVVLDEGEACAHGGQRGGLVVVETERGPQVLVDVGVHRDDRGAGGGEVADEERGQRGLAAAALPHESDLHVHQG